MSVLVVCLHKGRWRIAWDDAGEVGTVLGEGQVPTSAAVKIARSALARARSEKQRYAMAKRLRHLLAEYHAARCASARHDDHGLYWEVWRDADDTCRRCNEEIKGLVTTWPEWAIKAKSEGWIPPEGWMP